MPKHSRSSATRNGQRTSLGRVDPLDPSSRERAAHEAGVQQAGQPDVGDEGAGSGEQASVLHPSQAAAGLPRGAADVGGRGTRRHENSLIRGRISVAMSSTWSR